MTNGYASTAYAAVVSIPLSVTVILTALLFPAMIYNKIFMEIIVLISICDIMGNWPYALGFLTYPRNGTPLCSFEGFCNLFFYPASWTYTTMLTYLLKSLLMYGLKPLQLSRYVIHSLCLGLPLVLALVQLATNTYGVSVGSSGEEVCSYGGNIAIGNAIHAVIYDGFLLLNFIIMIGFLVQLWQLSYRHPVLARSPAFMIVLRALAYYPIALVVCWMPHVVYSLVNFSYNDGQAASLASIFDCFKVLHGGLTTVIFFHHSNEARSRWWDLLKGGASKCLAVACCGVIKPASFKFRNTDMTNRELLPSSSLPTSMQSDSEGGGHPHDANPNDITTDSTLTNGVFRSSSLNSATMNDRLVRHDHSALFDTPNHHSLSTQQAGGAGNPHVSTGNTGRKASTNSRPHSRVDSMGTYANQYNYTTDKIMQSIANNSNSNSNNNSNNNSNTASKHSSKQSSKHASNNSSLLHTPIISSDAPASGGNLADWPQDSMLIQIFTQVAIEHNLQRNTPFGLEAFNSVFASPHTQSSSVSSLSTHSSARMNRSNTHDSHGTNRSNGTHTSQSAGNISSSPSPGSGVSRSGLSSVMSNLQSMFRASTPTDQSTHNNNSGNSVTSSSSSRQRQRSPSSHASSHASSASAGTGSTTGSGIQRGLSSTGPGLQRTTTETEMTASSRTPASNNTIPSADVV
jgi:hypothetical protein